MLWATRKKYGTKYLLDKLIDSWKYVLDNFVGFIKLLCMQPHGLLVTKISSYDLGNKTCMCLCELSK